MDQEQSGSTCQDGPFGIHPVRLDEAGRLKLPARFKNHLSVAFPGERLFVTSLDKVIGRIYPISVWKQNLKALDAATQMQQQARKLRFIANDLGQDGELDKAGRIGLHPKLRQALGLELGGDEEKQTVWVQWARDGVDIYTRTVYEKLTTESYEDAEANADALITAGLVR